MAESKRSTSRRGGMTVVRVFTLLLLVGVWAFVMGSLVGYNPADPPGHVVWPANDPVANWYGPLVGLAHARVGQPDENDDRSLVGDEVLIDIDLDFAGKGVDALEEVRLNPGEHGTRGYQPFADRVGAASKNTSVLTWSFSSPDNACFLDQNSI